MKYDVNKLPDFYSVRDYTQVDYSLENMEGKKCFCFFDNGFNSNIIEPNKRDIKFIWDGFILLVDENVTLEDIRNGVNLYNARLVAFQRTNLLGKKFNDPELRSYILDLLNRKGIPFEIMEDEREVSGYPSRSDLWSTREFSVLLDAVDSIGSGGAFYFQNSDFHFEITFNKSNLPTFFYSHLGALVLHGENSTAISRLINNDNNLKDYLKKLVGSDKIYSHLEGKSISGSSISNIENGVKSVIK